MTAEATPIAERLREHIRRTLRSSPVLWATYRREVKARRPHWAMVAAGVLATLVVGPLMLVIYPLFLIHAVTRAVGLDLLLAAAGTLATAGGLGLAAALRNSLQRSQPLSVLSHLPAADAEIARQVWQNIFLRSTAALYVGGLFFGYAAWAGKAGLPGAVLAVTLVFVLWLTLASLGTLAFTARPRWAHSDIAGALGLCVVMVVAGAAIFPQVLRPKPVADVLYLLTPGGWIIGVFGRGWLAGNVSAWWALAPTALVIVSLPAARRRLAEQYAVAEFSIRPDSEASARIVGPLAAEVQDVTHGDAQIPAHDLPAVSPDAGELDALWTAADSTLAAAEAERRVRAANLLTPPDWTRHGWIERVVGRWLTRRERALVELLAGPKLVWSQLFASLGLLVPLIAVIEAFDLGRGIVAWFAMFTLGPAVLSGPWPGFLSRNCGGTWLPHYAVFPAMFGEMHHVLLKTCLLRTLIALPVAAALTLYALTGAGARPEVAALLVGGFAAAVPLIQSWVAVAHLSHGFRLPLIGWRTLLLALVPIALVLFGWAAAMVLLFSLGGGPARNWWPVALAVLVGGTLLLRWFYGLLDRRRPVDLTFAKPPSSQAQWIARQQMERTRERRGVCRQRFGLLWWLRRDLRRWVAQEE
ncbi:MAG: hypothetical protein KY476_21490 [Planctomycetes bacterium]|nr:hypothetical protein [Planctomycetota bacterium]